MNNINKKFVEYALYFFFHIEQATYLPFNLIVSFLDNVIKQSTVVSALLISVN